MKKKMKKKRKNKEKKNEKKNKNKEKNKRAISPSKEEARKQRIEKIKTTLSQQIRKFSRNHNVYIFCYPSGVKYNSKKQLAAQCLRQNIYICHSICEEKCESFLMKSYICSDIGCTHYLICASKSPSERKSFCKRRNLLKERIQLNNLYKKFFYVVAVYRGLKIDPVKTLKYLDRKKDGKIQHKKRGKENKGHRKGKTK